MALTTDFVIIGAGAVGMSTALELAQRGARVTVLERGRSGAESTWAGGGILSPLLPWHYGDAVNALSEYSRRLFPEWCARLEALAGLDAEYRASGMLVLPPFDRHAAQDWCADHGWRCEFRQPAEVMLPHLPGPALWLPDVAQVRNPRLAAVLRGAALQAGVRIVEAAEVTGLEHAAGRLTCVHSSRGDYSAAGYVLAAGAWSGSLAGLSGLSDRVFPVRGQMLLFKLPQEMFPGIVLRNGAYLIPRRDGHVLAGSTLEHSGFDKSTTDAAKRDLLDFAASVLPDLSEMVLARQWSGLRPGSPDNVPVIGAHPGYENLFVNSGHFRYGVTMSPGSAMLLADIIESRPPALDAKPYALHAAAGVPSGKVA
jgi:glycine oxidase